MDTFRQSGKEQEEEQRRAKLQHVKELFERKKEKRLSYKELDPSLDPFYSNVYEPYVIPYELTYHYFPKPGNTSPEPEQHTSVGTRMYMPSSHPIHETENASKNTTNSTTVPIGQATSNNQHLPHNSSTSYSRYISPAGLNFTQPNYLYQQDQNYQSHQCSTTTPKLIWLLLMHRHGDRNPINMAPKDPYNNISYWPEGFGNLNNAGRLRMYKLGKYIRKRYSHFLSNNIREIYTRSSDVDRCIESAQALLAGLYPPNHYNNWNPQLLWTPAPVHTVPPPEDYLLNEAGRKYLNNYIREIELVQKSEPVRELYAESVRERELLERELGYEFDLFTKFKCANSCLDIEERNGLHLPIWYTPEMKQRLYRFSGLAFKYAASGTEKLKKIRSGHLLEDLIERMEMSTIEGPMLQEHDRECDVSRSWFDNRVVHYSTHDSILAVLLEALGINEPTPVPPAFGATLFLELYVDLNEQEVPVTEKYIKIFYLDDTASEKPIEKKLPSTCGVNEKGQVTLNTFKRYVAHLLPNGTP